MPVQNTEAHAWLAQDILSDGPIQNIGYWLGQIDWIPGGPGQSYNPLKNGAVGNGIIDDTVAIAGILASGRTIVLPEGYTFLVSQMYLNGLSDITVTGGGLLVGTNRLAPVLLANACTRIQISGIKVKHQTPGARTGVGAIQLNTPNTYEVTGCEVINSSGLGIYVFAGTYGRVHHNTVHNTGADGINHQNLPGGTPAFSSLFAVDHNIVYATGDDSVSVVGYIAAATQNSDFSITGNVCYQSKNGGVDISGGRNGTVTGNLIDTTQNYGIGVLQSTGNATLGSNNITVFGNTIANANTFTPSLALPSIYVAVDSATYPIDGVLIAANRISQSNHSYIQLQSTSSTLGCILTAAIKGNVCEGPMLGGTATDPGIYAIAVNSVTISDNDVWLASGMGILAETVTAAAIITNNKVWHPNQGNQAGQYGILNQAVAGGVASSNVVVPDGTKTALAANVSITNSTIGFS
jgi:hypothetical protein